MNRWTTAGLAFAAACSAEPLDESATTSDPTTSTGAAGSTGEAVSSSGSEPDVGQDPLNDCDVWAQDCPPGEKCVAYGDLYDVDCSPVPAMPGQVGDACVYGYDWDSCDFGTYCWFLELDLTVCVELCRGSPNQPVCSDPGTECVISNDGALTLCMTSCDPIARDCDHGACIRVDQAVQTVCSPDASGPEGQFGDPCEDDISCDPGLFCSRPDSVPGCSGTYGCCSAWCDLSAPDPDAQCPGQAEGQRCASLYAPAPTPPGSEHVGVCTLPL